MKRSQNAQGRWLFATNFLKRPGMLGSVIPSSGRLIDRLLAPVDWKRAKRIVEFGPGVGTITRDVLARMSPDARMLVLELNPEFVDYLKRELPDPRLEVLELSAAELGNALQERGWDNIDYALSGIPFSTMPPEVRDSILRQTRDAVGSDGEFLVYQFSGRSHEPLLQTFGAVTKSFEPWNFLPAHCYRCRSGVKQQRPETVEARAAGG